MTTLSNYKAISQCDNFRVNFHCSLVDFSENLKMALNGTRKRRIENTLKLVPKDEDLVCLVLSNDNCDCQLIYPRDNKNQDFFFPRSNGNIRIFAKREVSKWFACSQVDWIVINPQKNARCSILSSACKTLSHCKNLNPNTKYFSDRFICTLNVNFIPILIEALEDEMNGAIQDKKNFINTFIQLLKDNS